MLALLGAIVSELFRAHATADYSECVAIGVVLPNGGVGGVCDEDPPLHGQPWSGIFGTALALCLAVLLVLVAGWVRWRWVTRDIRRAEARLAEPSLPLGAPPDWSDWSHRT